MNADSLPSLRRWRWVSRETKAARIPTPEWTLAWRRVDRKKVLEIERSQLACAHTEIICNEIHGADLRVTQRWEWFWFPPSRVENVYDSQDICQGTKKGLVSMVGNEPAHKHGSGPTFQSKIWKDWAIPNNCPTAEFKNIYRNIKISTPQKLTARNAWHAKKQGQMSHDEKKTQLVKTGREFTKAFTGLGAQPSRSACLACTGPGVNLQLHGNKKTVFDMSTGSESWVRCGVAAHGSIRVSLESSEEDST